ncbi:hypothetical protein [Nitrososphaeria virus YSH_922147]|uniref:Uncharacterized protein n=1 Tax=Nitrososphaeria virus YSH_922147 TaxID=3071323 RepID=A0A976UBJ6_9CAUD|nr:hypothetical protein QKV94_gp12 [Yangshan Harbor Nitrososphaeria virus]UVF62421.1 hypothetical protein [Nitrososphaeria virus YSH_922147]
MNFSERMVTNSYHAWMLYVNSSCEKCQEKWCDQIHIGSSIMTVTPRHKIKIKINNI